MENFTVGGDGYDGANGLGHENFVTEPTRVDSETGWTKVSALGSEICALKDEEVYCWGRHSSDFPNTYYLLRPVRLLGGHKWTYIDLGFYHGCGISEGVAYCWGQNEDRQSGYEGPAKGSLPDPSNSSPNASAQHNAQAYKQPLVAQIAKTLARIDNTRWCVFVHNRSLRFCGSSNKGTGTLSPTVGPPLDAKAFA